MEWAAAAANDEMMKFFIAILAAGLMLCLAVPASAEPAPDTDGPTNYRHGGYPAHGCARPELPLPDDRRDKEALALFESRLEAYKICIMRYLAAAQADQQRVVERANEAVDEYNGLLESWLDSPDRP